MSAHHTCHQPDPTSPSPAPTGCTDDASWSTDALEPHPADKVRVDVVLDADTIAGLQDTGSTSSRRPVWASGVCEIRSSPS